MARQSIGVPSTSYASGKLASRRHGDASSEHSLESLWRRAAAATLATGRQLDPPVGELRRLTEPKLAWIGFEPWPRAALDGRIGRLFDCHRLAIARRDTAWLRRLERTWSVVPGDVDEMRVLRAAGEIGLGLSPEGARVNGWTADEIEALVEEAFVIPNVPTERAWLELARGNLERAHECIAQAVARRARGWRPDPWIAPGAVLDVELRALRALAGRAGSDKAPH